MIAERITNQPDTYATQDKLPEVVQKALDRYKKILTVLGHEKDIDFAIKLISERSPQEIIRYVNLWEETFKKRLKKNGYKIINCDEKKRKEKGKKGRGNGRYDMTYSWTKTGWVRITRIETVKV